MRSDPGRWTLRGIFVLVTFLSTSCVIESEGRSSEARATLTSYLNALAGAADDRGWSLLSESTRDGYGEREAVLELADLAGDALLPIQDVRLIYEDDGFYQFAVTTTDPMDPIYAELLFRAAGAPRPSPARPDPAKWRWPSSSRSSMSTKALPG
jgi:hypothetical protein